MVHCVKGVPELARSAVVKDRPLFEAESPGHPLTTLGGEAALTPEVDAYCKAACDGPPRALGATHKRGKVVISWSGVPSRRSSTCRRRAGGRSAGVLRRRGRVTD